MWTVLFYQLVWRSVLWKSVTFFYLKESWEWEYSNKFETKLKNYKKKLNGKFVEFDKFELLLNLRGDEQLMLKQSDVIVVLEIEVENSSHDKI